MATSIGPQNASSPRSGRAVDATSHQSIAPIAPYWLNDCLSVVKVARPGFWPTHLWFYGLPLAGVHLFGSVGFWFGAFYVCFPMGLLLYGWNDLGDAATDAINPRKDSWLFGARPDQSLRRRLPWIIVAVQLPFLIALPIVGGPRLLLWAAAVVLTNWTYNNLGWKSRPGLDMLNQVGYLLVFVLAIWLCGVNRLNAAALCFSALFAMQSHLFGQLMDIGEDAAAGRRTTAVAIGLRPAKVLLSGLMLTEAVIAWTQFRGEFVGHFLAIGSLFFLVDAWKGPPRYPVAFVKAFFVVWNLIVLATMHLVWRYGWFLLDG